MGKELEIRFDSYYVHAIIDALEKALENHLIGGTENREATRYALIQLKKAIDGQAV